MPELPEVEAIRRELERVLPGKSFLNYQIYDPKVLSFPSGLFDLIRNRPVSCLKRTGKYLFIHFDNSEISLQVHLGMAGYLGFSPALCRTDFMRLIFILDKGCLFYDDMRKFGSLSLLRNKDLQSGLFRKLGPDALIEELFPTDLHFKAQKRCLSMHSLLLDQHFIAGLGNIYTCEVLFDAGISPLRRSCDNTLADWERLVLSIGKIMNRAVQINATTFVNHPFRQRDKDFFEGFLKVYGKEGKACPRCHRSILRVKIQRSIYYCSLCQV